MWYDKICYDIIWNEMKINKVNEIIINTMQ